MPSQSLSFFPRSAEGGLFRAHAAGFRPRLKIKAQAGIATSIPLPVDLLWPEWICVPSQNCSGTQRFRWSCGTPILLPNTRHRQLTVWSRAKIKGTPNRTPRLLNRKLARNKSYQIKENKEVKTRRVGRARLNAPDSKSDVLERVPGVRIPHSPPLTYLRHPRQL